MILPGTIVRRLPRNLSHTPLAQGILPDRTKFVAVRHFAF